MKLEINTRIASKNCKYLIKKEFAPSCYLGTAILSGGLGDIESSDTILVVANQGVVSGILNSNHRASVMEFISYSGEKLLILSDSDENRQFITSQSRTHTDTPTNFGTNRYQGGTLNGRPHGQGVMRYGDGKVYIGTFVNGLRHGNGKLVMPSGEYFEGQFQNDSITENGTYYDENGRPRNVRKTNKKTVGTIIWEKTWRLWASIACFALAALLVWLIVEFFTSKKGGIIRVGIFIAPLALAWWGLKSFVGFFTHLFPSQTE
ncbi:MAG: hypothetical protein NC336_07900 [Clostridium sp.]|nr:hypothetical protein [Clostridium sp.]